MSDNSKKQIVKGELLSYGFAPYKDDPDQSQSYFVEIKHDSGIVKKEWGVDLERALKESNVRIGDTVILNNLGRQPVNIPDPEDETKTKTVTKNLWEVEKYEPVLDLPNVIEHDTEREQEKTVVLDKTKENEQGDPSTPNQAKKVPDLSEFDFELPDNIKNNYFGIVKNRYLLDQKTNYYDKDDKNQVNIAFEDRNKSLHTSRQDEKTIYAMLDMAQAKNWTTIKLKGTDEFKQKAWLEASLRGIEVKGYEPNEKDLAELKARQAERSVNTVIAEKIKEVETVKSELKQEDDLDKSTLEMIKSLDVKEVQNLSEEDFNKRLKSIEKPLNDSNFLVFQALRTGNENWIREAKQISDLNEKTYLSAENVDRRYNLSEEMRKFLEKKENNQEKNFNEKEEVKDYTEHNLKGKTQKTYEKTDKEIKQEIKTLVQESIRDGSIKDRSDIVERLKERGFEVLRENEKSITLSNPSGKDIRLEGELFTKNYNALKSLNEGLKPENIKEKYPQMSDENIAKVNLWRENVLSKFETVEARQNALSRLKDTLPDVASGKLDLGQPKIPANEIKPEIEVRIPDSGDQSRSR